MASLLDINYEQHLKSFESLSITYTNTKGYFDLLPGGSSGFCQIANIIDYLDKKSLQEFIKTSIFKRFFKNKKYQNDLYKFINNRLYKFENHLTLKGHTDRVRSVEFNSVAFNHDDTKIVSGSYDRTIRVWNVDTDECILTLKGHTEYVRSVVFNYDGTKIVSGSDDNTIRVWNVDTCECILTLKGHTDFVNSVGFNHDGTKIVSGSIDKTIRVWNVDTGECILTLEGHKGYVDSVVFNHDGTKIVSASHDNTIRVWEMVEFVK